jgi:hypothetical protein
MKSKGDSYESVTINFFRKKIVSLQSGFKNTDDHL